MSQPVSFSRVLLACLVAGLTGVATLLLLGNGGWVPWFPATVVFPLAGLLLMATVLFPLGWRLRKPEAPANQRLYGGLLVGIRYLAAFNIACFGWKKLFGLQFIVPPAIASQPINQLSGEWLTWFYFGHSQAFGLIIAGLQIGGACLLLFDRTVLLGATVLCAVLLNLSLINIFYQLNVGALLQSLVATLDVVFLLGLHYQQLVAFFLPAPDRLTAGSPARTLPRLSAILLALLFTAYLSALLPSRP